MTRQREKQLWIAAACLVEVYVLIRAFTISFTHDEGLLYHLIRGDAGQAGVLAQHHLTIGWMYLNGHLTGYSELSLRFGSIAALSLYLWGGFFLLWRLPSTALRWGGFGLLFLQPIVLDFFSVASGYAWGFAGMMGMLIAFYGLSEEGIQDTAPTPAWKWVVLGGFSALIAVLGNVIFAHTALPFLLLLLMQCLRAEHPKHLPWRRILPLLVLFLAGAGFLAAEQLQLQGSSALFQGDGHRLIAQTLASLCDANLYRAVYAQQAGALPYMIAFLAAILALLAWMGWRKYGPPSFFTTTGIWLTLTIGWIFIQHWLFKMPLPTDQSSVFLLPLLSGTLLAGFWALYRRQKAWTRTAATDLARLTGLLCLFHFFQTVNVSDTYYWLSDRHTRDVIEKIAQTRHLYAADRPVQIAAHALFEPTLNYYRTSRKYDWLLPIPADGVRNSMADAYYTFSDDFDNIPMREIGVKEQKSYWVSRTALWKREQ
jgi:hypothetical protein